MSGTAQAVALAVTVTVCDERVSPSLFEKKMRIMILPL